MLVRPPAALAGLIEVRGVGIVRLAHEAGAVVGLVVDLDAADAERLPERQDAKIEGVAVPRLAVAPGAAALPVVIGHLMSSRAAIADDDGA